MFAETKVMIFVLFLSVSHSLPLNVNNACWLNRSHRFRLWINGQHPGHEPLTHEHEHADDKPIVNDPEHSPK